MTAVQKHSNEKRRAASRATRGNLWKTYEFRNKTSGNRYLVSAPVDLYPNRKALMNAIEKDVDEAMKHIRILPLRLNNAEAQNE